jgi:hypothetical protein
MDPILVTKPMDMEIVKNNRTGHKILKHIVHRKTQIHNTLANSNCHQLFIHYVTAVYVLQLKHV